VRIDFFYTHTSALGISFLLNNLPPKHTYAATMASHPVADKEVEVPEWEHTGAATDNGTVTRAPGSTLRQKLDSTMPPHKKYFGMKRNVFLLVLLAAVLALLALIIGLAVGLTQKSKYDS
jgi:hypothetical protein